MAKPVTFSGDNMLHNRLREKRSQLGLTQEELAEKAGIARQTVSGIEAGQYGPSLVVALRLAQALNTPVETLFWFPQPVKPGKELVKCIGPVKKGGSVRLVRLPQGLVAFPLSSHDFFQEANGQILELYNQDKALVEDFNPELTGQSTVILAGCSPALAVLVRKLHRRYKDVSFFWAPVNSMQAIRALRDGLVQVAGLHLFDEQSGEYNLPVIQRTLWDKEYVVYSFCFGEQGLLVQKSNPKRIGGIGDLTRGNISLVNREKGSEARRILDSTLKENDFSPGQVCGYSFEVNTHLEVAQAVSLGAADCGVAMKSVALAFDLEFIPFTRERYDLVFLKKDMENPGVQVLLESLHNVLLKKELEVCGYDTTVSGKNLFVSK
jgi:molybdate-binding protein/DNA-binding XRE family transcriptional regulator